MRKEIEAIVMAGGNGSRMGELTANQQKCLLPIEGEPILGRVIETLVKGFGSVDLVVAIGYQADQVKDYVISHKPPKVNVSFVPHTPGTETWGVLRNMHDFVSGNFITVPGDVLALPEVYVDSIQRLEQDKDADCVVTLSPDLDAANTHGVGKIQDGFVVDLTTPPPVSIPLGYWRNMTIYSFNLRIFQLLEDYPSPKQSLGVALMKAIQDGRLIAGNKYTLSWVHLGDTKDLSKSFNTEPERLVMVQGECRGRESNPHDL